MAAYASLVCLMNLIDQIQNHPRPPITLHKGQVELLCSKITFLQKFLETYSHISMEEAGADVDGFESRIADVAHAAADLIESHIAKQISDGVEGNTYFKVNQSYLHRAMEEAAADLDKFMSRVSYVADSAKHLIVSQIPNLISDVVEDNITSFKEFLHSHVNMYNAAADLDAFKISISNVAYAAVDLIQSHIEKRISDRVEDNTSLKVNLQSCFHRAMEEAAADVDRFKSCIKYLGVSAKHLMKFYSANLISDGAEGLNNILQMIFLPLILVETAAADVDACQSSIDEIESHTANPISDVVDMITSLQEFLESNSATEKAVADVDVFESRIADYTAADVIESHTANPISDGEVDMITSLQEFLESNTATEKAVADVDVFESRIADYTAADVIESHTANPISDGAVDKSTSSQEFLESYTDMEKAVADVDVFESRIPDLVYTAADVIESHTANPILDGVVDKITSLQEFLESYTAMEKAVADVDVFESRIADLVYTAADVIESHRANPISDGVGDMKVFYNDLHKLIEAMSLVMEEAMEIKEKLQTQDHQLRSTAMVGLERSPLVGLKSTDMVGFDDVFHEVLEKLTTGQSRRHVIPIVGMGGIGKTTLATHAYEHQSVLQHFDVCCWVTVSQDYDVPNILLKLLLDLNKNKGKEVLSQVSEEDIGVKLYKSLFGRRYLVVMDDMWSVDVWNEINRFFPNEDNRSRIMITTRHLWVASELSDNKIVIDFLDDENSWKLLCKLVFDKEVCPIIELEESGRKIANNCKGLPLSITVMGGLLANSNQTQECWGLIANKMNSNMNLKHDEFCMRILRTSLDHMPIHLKPCFLYMAVYPEDKRIRASSLIMQWVVEGFVKPIYGKSLESVAEEYLMDLINRNIIFADYVTLGGKVKYCRVHDVIRELCIKEAEKERFIWVARKHNLDIQRNINVHRRIVIHWISLQKEHFKKALDTLQLASLGHSVVCNGGEGRVIPHVTSKILRVLYWTADYDFRKAEVNCAFQSVNMRSFVFECYFKFCRICFKMDSSIYLFWNLQTLIIPELQMPSSKLKIWNMHQLRHVKVNKLYLSDPDPLDGELVLSNLQTLSSVIDFRFGYEVIRSIPNIRNLKVIYSSLSDFYNSKYHISNLCYLQKLESLTCEIDKPRHIWDILFPNTCISFPHSVVKLKLCRVPFCWEEITTQIGALPHLQVLSMTECGYGPEWNLVEGKFQRLISLDIQEATDLENWTAEGNHFPSLEFIELGHFYALKEIPQGIGDAPKLKCIMLKDCTESVVSSAKKIIDEQEEFGNAGLKVQLSDDKGHFVELRPTSNEGEEV